MEPDIPRRQLEAAKHTMIRRRTDLSVYARLILAEMMSYDFLLKDCGGIRKGRVWCSQQRIGDKLGIHVNTVNRYMKQVIRSPFIKGVSPFRS